MSELATTTPFSVMELDTVYTRTSGTLGLIHTLVDEIAVVGEVMLFGASVLTIVHPDGTWDTSRVEQLRAEGHSKMPVVEASVSHPSVWTVELDAPINQAAKLTFIFLRFVQPLNMLV